MTAPAAAPAVPTAAVRHNRVDLALHHLRASGGSAPATGTAGPRC